jgi:hypothetical protein
VYADSHLVVTRTEEPAGLCFAGEIDSSNARAVADFLSNGFAGESRQEGRLMLHGLPNLLQRVMAATGWANLPHLVVVS